MKEHEGKDTVPGEYSLHQGRERIQVKHNLIMVSDSMELLQVLNFPVYKQHQCFEESNANSKVGKYETKQRNDLII